MIKDWGGKLERVALAVYADVRMLIGDFDNAFSVQHRE